MKTYAALVDRLGIKGVCLGGCGLTDHAHKGSIFLDVVHFGERRVSRRGLRKLLLLCARRDRLRDPEFLNAAGLWWAAMYLDERKANEWADRIGYRFPISYSLPERRSVALVPGLSRRSPAVYAWAHRAETVNKRFWDADDTEAQAAENFL